MDESRRRITKYLKSLAEDRSKLVGLLCKGFDRTCEKVSKDSELSEKARKEGNKLFLQNKHDSLVHHKILHFYNESIAFAPDESEQLALAYGNRSALLRHIRRYSECITEIDKALKITKCAQTKVKLLCRKADCLTSLGSNENRNCLEKARFNLARMNDSEEMKNKLADLITRTQSIIDAEKLDQPKENRRLIESRRIAEIADKADFWSSVRVEYNEKYGRHLVAARDFKPGEIVIMEKPYVNVLDESRKYMYCSHCWLYLWSVNPCKNCTLRLFCSEECRIEALNDYHDEECSVVVGMRGESSLRGTHMIPFLIRVFFRILKEAGSINQLQEDLKVIDECKDQHRGVFSSSGEFKSYNVIYTLPTRREKGIMQMCMEISVSCLLGIAKHSSIFGRRYDSSKIDELIEDDSAVFVGALLLKIFRTIINRIMTVHLHKPSENVDKLAVEFPLHQDQISSSIRSLGFLTIIGCIPNVSTFITKTNRHVTFSLSPIKKGSPLVTSTVGGIYSYSKTSERQAIHQISFGRPCDCPACVEDWLKVLEDDGKFMDSMAANTIIGKKLVREKVAIDDEIRAKAHSLDFPDARLLPRAKNLVAEAWEYFPMPSRVTVGAINSLMDVIKHIYAPQKWEFQGNDSCKA